MTHPPETVHPGARQRFAPYEVPRAGALLTTTPIPPFRQVAPPVAAAETTASLPPVVEPAGPLDPRVAAFGTGPVRPDPSLLATALRWIVPVGTGLFGVVLGVVLSSSGDRPTAPVSVYTPATTVTATQRATVTAQAPDPSTVTRRVTTTKMQVTTAPPPAPSTVTVTARETVTVGGARNPAPRAPGRRRLLP